MNTSRRINGQQNRISKTQDSVVELRSDVEPQNWPSLAWRIVRERPTAFLVALVVGYFAFRLYDVDPIDQPLRQIAARFNMPAGRESLPDVSGDWEYVSRDARTGARWGGVITIDSYADGKRQKLTIRGKRTWVAAGSDETRIKLSPAVPWTADDAVFLPEGSSVQYRYVTRENEERSLEGVTTLFIETTAKSMTGRFSDMFEVQPRWGTTELQRTALR